MLFTDDEFKLFKEELEGGSIGIVWSAIRADNLGKDHLSFLDKKNYFFEFLQRLLQEGKIKLAAHGEYLEGSIDQQIELYRDAFPKNQEEMEDGAFDGFWFLTEKCPGGIVWIHENGYLDWT